MNWLKEDEKDETGPGREEDGEEEGSVDVTADAKEEEGERKKKLAGSGGRRESRG